MGNTNQYVLPEGVRFLYHATYKCLEASIMKKGLLRGQEGCWELKSKDYKDYVYLAFEPEIAYGYAEDATDEIDDNNDERIYSKIMLIAIPVDTLDLTKLDIDKTNESNYTDEVTTLQYKGDIPNSDLIIIRTTMNEMEGI